jgi:anti-sigma factor RsiW
VSLQVQHLSDEAIAAFADGFLGAGARSRATRHVSGCAECARAVAVQREAAWALRSAVAPAPPSGLLDRLRSVPSTTALPSDTTYLAGDGTAVFPAFGTSGYARPAPTDPGSSFMRSLLATSASGRRRTQHVALATAAIALVAVGVAASASSTTAAGQPTGGLPRSGTGVSIVPAVQTVLPPTVLPPSR